MSKDYYRNGRTMVSNGQISTIDKLFKAIRNVCRLSRRKKEGHDPPPPSAMILRKRHPEEKWRGRRGWKVISQLIMRYRVCLMFRRWRSERGSERKGKEKKKKREASSPFFGLPLAPSQYCPRATQREQQINPHLSFCLRVFQKRRS